MIVDGWRFPEVTTVEVRDLARAWRWRPCELCFSRSSWRVLIVVGTLERVFCAIESACDARRSR